MQCETAGGDVETVPCIPLGRNVRIVLGSIPTRLGKPLSGSGQLEISGDDRVTVTYLDHHNAAQEPEKTVLAEVVVVGTAKAEITELLDANPPHQRSEKKYA